MQTATEKPKKSTFRALWITRINAGTREYGMSYSVFMGNFHTRSIEPARKELADLAMYNPSAFNAIFDLGTLLNSNTT